MKTDSEKPVRREISLTDLFVTFPDDETAGQWLEKNTWPDGRRRPKCGHDDTAPTKIQERHPPRVQQALRCQGGNHHGSLPRYRNWVIAAYLPATRPKGTSGMQLHRDRGIKQGTAWLLLRRMRKSWHMLAGSDPMSGPVGADEACPGGREKSKHADVESRTSLPPSASGTGAPYGPDRCRKPPWPVLSTSSSPTSSRTPRRTLAGTVVPGGACAGRVAPAGQQAGTAAGRKVPRRAAAK